MKKDLGLGVIGIGMGLDYLYLNSDESSRMEIRGICAKTPEKVKKAGERSGIDFTTTDYKELIKRKDIDAIAVYSPDPLHAQHTIDAFNKIIEVFDLD